MTRMTCGIYCIVNTQDGKVYVGSSVSIGRRMNQHKVGLRRGSHHSQYLQRAFDKRGGEAFVWTILESCPAESLCEREQFWMDALAAADSRTGYNMCPAAGSTLGMKFGPLSAEHREKIAAGHRGKTVSVEHRAAIGAARKGRKLPPEWVANMAAAQLGRKMGPLSEEHKARISAVHKGKTISDAHKARLSATHKGKKQSPELVAKRAAAMKASWARRKAETAAPATEQTA